MYGKPSYLPSIIMCVGKVDIEQIGFGGPFTGWGEKKESGKILLKSVLSTMRAQYNLLVRVAQ